jgi:uncharacterized membrane protein
VKLPSILVPKQPRNLLLTLGASVLIILLDLAIVPSWQRSPKRGFGLFFGILATALFLFEMSYPARRPRARPFKSAKAWVQAHVYLGLIALVAVFIHAGYTWPHGLMGWLLLIASAWVSLSGLLGVFLQKWIPATLAEGLAVTALYERIPSLVKELEAEAEALAEGSSEAVEEFYRTQVRPGLSTLKPSTSFLLDVRGGRDRALEPFNRMADFVSPEDKETIEGLRNIYTDKMELDAQYSLQGILRRWSFWTLHVPLAGMLLGLVAVHIATWVFY